MAYHGWTISQDESGFVATCPWFALTLRHDSSIEKLKSEIDDWDE